MTQQPSIAAASDISAKVQNGPETRMDNAKSWNSLQKDASFPKYGEAIQLTDIEELCRRIEAKQDSLVDYVSRDNALVHSASFDDKVGSTYSGETVKVTAVVRKTTQVLSAIFLTSLVMWTYTDFPIVNPFIAALGLIVAPFFWWMANTMDKQQSE